MKKLIRKVKKLFIEELEVRRSTSPLLVQTMAVGEAGVSIKNNKEGSSSAGALDSAQKAKEAMIAEKNDSTNIVALYAPPSPVTSMNLGEEGNEISKKTEENGRPPVQPLYAAPKPTNKIAESGKPPVQPLYAAPKPTNEIAESGKPPVQPLYAAPKPTDKIAESGKPPIFVVAVHKYAPPMPIISIPVEKYAPPRPVTSLSLGEEGNQISKKTEESGKPPVQPLYAAPKPTNKIAESGKPPILIAAPSQGKKKITILLGEDGKPRI